MVCQETENVFDARHYYVPDIDSIGPNNMKDDSSVSPGSIAFI
jgi:hypothetical protein